jgi:hypothetical protein|tara:strand:- start:816 stop:1352 length:537 start_codon:yes stop_codon:yes gene_type:complete
MNQYYKESTKVSIYKRIIKQVFNISLDTKGRVRNLVDARMVFTKLMRDKKATYQSIALHLNLKSHASVMHYYKSIQFLMLHDKELKKKYDMCVKLYNLTDPAPNILKPDELKNRCLNLEDKNKLLSLEIETLKKQLQKTSSQEERFKTIFDIIRTRTKLNTEKVIEKKLNTIFNGIYD